MLRRDGFANLARAGAMCATSWSGSMYLWITPFLFSALKQIFHTTTVQAASLISAILTSGGVAVLLAGLLLPNLGIAGGMILGTALQLVGLVWLAQGGGVLLALLPAILTGIGSGLVMAMVPRIAARTPSPERAYGLTAVTNTLLATAFFAMIPTIRMDWGAASILFLHLAAAAILAPVALLGLPHLCATTVKSATRTADKGTARLAGGLMIAGQLLYSVAMGSYWAFIEPAAATAGIGPETVGWTVSVATLLSLVGPVVAVWLSNRTRRTVPLAAGRVLFALSAAATLVAATPIGYFNAILIASAMIVFIPAFDGGVLIRLDPSARMANASSAIGFLLNGAGPIVGGLVMTRFGMAGLALCVAALSILAALAQILPSLIVDRAVEDRPDAAPLGFEPALLQTQ